MCMKDLGGASSTPSRSQIGHTLLRLTRRVPPSRADNGGMAAPAQLQAAVQQTLQVRVTHCWPLRGRRRLLFAARSCVVHQKSICTYAQGSPLGSCTCRAMTDAAVAIMV